MHLIGKFISSMTTAFVCCISLFLLFTFHYTSYIFFVFYPPSWLSPLFSTGYKRSLEEDDMFEVLPEDKSERLGQELQRYNPWLPQEYYLPMTAKGPKEHFVTPCIPFPSKTH